MKPIYADMLPGKEALAANSVFTAGLLNLPVVGYIHRTPGAQSLDAIKRRTFATAGRCQGGFCTPKIMEILERELGIPADGVTKRGPGSELVVGTNKDRLATPEAGKRGGEA